MRSQCKFTFRIVPNPNCIKSSTLPPTNTVMTETVPRCAHDLPDGELDFAYDDQLEHRDEDKKKVSQTPQLSMRMTMVNPQPTQTMPRRYVR